MSDQLAFIKAKKYLAVKVEKKARLLGRGYSLTDIPAYISSHVEPLCIRGLCTYSLQPTADPAIISHLRVKLVPFGKTHKKTAS